MHIAYRNVTKTFAGRVVLDTFSLEVEPGSVVMLLGANGSGKTTALRALVGLVRPDTGAATLDGVTYAELPYAGRRVGVALSAATADLELSPRALLRLRAMFVGATAEEVDEIVEQLGLRDARSTRLRRLSAGMQARTLLGVAAMGGPEVLVLDEPFANLDSRGREWLAERLRAIRLRNGSALLTSHHRDTFDLADRWVDVTSGKDVSRRAALARRGGR